MTAGRPDVDDGGSCRGCREGYGAALAAAVHDGEEVFEYLESDLVFDV